MSTDLTPEEALRQVAQALGRDAAERTARLEQLAREHGINLVIDIADVSIGDMLTYATSDHRRRVEMDVKLVTRLLSR